MADPSVKGKGGKVAKKPQPQPTTSVTAVAAPKGNDKEESDTVNILELLESHEKELLAVATELAAETSHYDAELHQLSEKLEAATVRLVQLERRFPTLALWRVPNFLENIRSARSGQCDKLTSPSYYLSRQGYRLAVSLHLYGDGNARGKYISLYVNLCRGEFDGSLSWPFTHRVYLSILDQTDDDSPRQNLTKVIMPKAYRENLIYLGRPRSSQNPRFGFEQFASLDDFLHNGRTYVLNDAIFVKLEVPCEDLKAV